MAIDKIISFGDSFMYGTDLPDCDSQNHSHLTWPALIAKELDMEYLCFAHGGLGNMHIAGNVLNSVLKDSFHIIGWTWQDRFDYCLPNNDFRTIQPSSDDELSRFYFKHLHSELGDKWRSLAFISTILNQLKEDRQPFLMTLLDRLVLDSRWNSKIGFTFLQDKLRENLTWFPGEQTFLEWSRSNNYPESVNWHPLEEAHAQAAEIMLPVVRQKINTYIK